MFKCSGWLWSDGASSSRVREPEIRSSRMTRLHVAQASDYLSVPDPLSCEHFKCIFCVVIKKNLNSEVREYNFEKSYLRFSSKNRNFDTTWTGLLEWLAEKAYFLYFLIVSVFRMRYCFKTMFGFVPSFYSCKFPVSFFPAERVYWMQYFFRVIKRWASGQDFAKNRALIQ